MHRRKFLLGLLAGLLPVSLLAQEQKSHNENMNKRRMGQEHKKGMQRKHKRNLKKGEGHRGRGVSNKAHEGRDKEMHEIRHGVHHNE